jgi:hypothetical protein
MFIWLSGATSVGAFFQAFHTVGHFAQASIMVPLTVMKLDIKKNFSYTQYWLTPCIPRFL